MKSITRDNPLFPQSLLSYEGCPNILYYGGDPALFNSPCVAIIGTRFPSHHACLVAYRLAAYLASMGYTIVSGLADGIDTSAHYGALSVGGKTIAILGSPLTDIYPRENLGLAYTIARRGGLVYTEYRTPAHDRSRFVVRDRLQAAQSLAVIPVQMGIDSGTRHAVNAAIAGLSRLIIPLPSKSDYTAYPEKYAGLVPHIKSGDHPTFRGSVDYPKLLSLLAE